MNAPSHPQVDQPYDLIVIGAGINGAGIARDAAMRGLRVLLLDKGDIGSGTSSWSTRLIHGGLRYLEHYEMGLVRESLRERERLLATAPHLVKPLPLLIPIYRGAMHGPLMVRAGMVAYDILSFDRSLDHHRMLSRQQAMARVPGLNSTDLRGAAVYYDAQVEYAERLVVENVLAARMHGATVRTGVEVRQLVIEGSRVVGVEFATLPDGATIHAHARFVLNVAGPWVDQVLQMLGRPGVPGAREAREARGARLIGGTKGSHIVVNAFPGAPRDGLYAEAMEDHRPYFILPWNDRYLIGTTDIPFAGDLDNLSADDAEIDYLLNETNRVIPSAGLTRESVLYSYTGVRPLPYISAETADSAGAITRRHILHDHGKDGIDGMISIIGGKLTTYRSLAEEAVDAVCQKLGMKTIPCATRKTPLPGAAGGYGHFIATFHEAHPTLSPQTANHLLRVYGVRAHDVLALAQAAPDLLEVFDPDTGAIAAEVVFAVREELATTLADILLRRTMVGLGPNVGLGADERATRIAHRHLDWDAARMQQELTDYRQYIQRFHPRNLPSTIERATPSTARNAWSPAQTPSPAPGSDARG